VSSISPITSRQDRLHARRKRARRSLVISTVSTVIVIGGLVAAGHTVATSGAAERQGIVHRLDANTTGVMVVAKSERAYSALKRAFRERTVAKRYHISKQAQDEYGVRSQLRAAAAQAHGKFDDEIVPVPTAAGPVGQDEGIRPGLTLEELAAKRPAFRKGGTVTGGNSSPLNDGAAALLLMSEEAVSRAGVTPLARYVGASAAGVHPDYMGIGPVPAMNRVLGRAGWRVEDLDLVELNEAFAAQSVACVDELKLDQEKVNVNGGAIAIGHPLGCSGARIVTTLLHEMRRRGAARGAASMCIGVGQGIATLWEAC